MIDNTDAGFTVKGGPSSTLSDGSGFEGANYRRLAFTPPSGGYTEIENGDGPPGFTTAGDWSMAVMSRGAAVADAILVVAETDPEAGSFEWAPDLPSAGLVVTVRTPPEIVLMSAEGLAESATAAIEGTTSGLTIAAVQCSNQSSGQQFLITPPPSGPTWDCTDAGLNVLADDEVRVIIAGPADDSGQNLSGAVTGMSLDKAECRNQFTGQQIEVALLPGETAWDCEAAAGSYVVYAKWMAGGERGLATYRVHHAGGATDVAIDQRSGGGVWVPLGTYVLDPGLAPSVELLAQGAGGSLTADALRFSASHSTTPPDNVFYLHTDHLGTPRLATDSAQTVIWDHQTLPFGATHVLDGPGESNLRFPGQYFDAESSLHYNYFRDYDPSTGRYIESDPIGLAGGINTYAYVGGNPISLIDPYGLEVTISLYEGAFVFAHTGIGVNSSDTTGFYQDENSSNFDMYIGKDVPRVMQPDTETLIDTITIETDSNQDKDMQELIDQLIEEPGEFNLYDQNCATTTIEILRRGNIICPYTIYPRILMLYLQRGLCIQP